MVLPAIYNLMAVSDFHIVLKASGLVSKDPNGKSDPYCCVYLGTIENSPHKTEVKYGTLNPVWNETFVIKGSELSPFLHTFGKQAGR